jgi:glycosyltransferase involved in cell wall biosynthesis
MDPLVSVVVTTKNEEKNIENCLKSILAQTYKGVEIIVVDNFSTDKTREIALKYTNGVFEKGPERSAQRNFGMIEKSGGKYVMFIDADMILWPNLIEDCVRQIEKGAVSALWIPEIVLGKRFFSKCRRFERSFYDGTVIDGSRFFKKDRFVAVGGFDCKMSGPEDWDLDKKIGRENIGLLENGQAIYHNETEFDLKRYLSKKGYYAESFENYINKWGKDDQDIKKQLGFLYRYFGVFLEKGKWKRLLAHPVLAGGMYFLRGLVGAVYLLNKKRR